MGRKRERGRAVRTRFQKGTGLTPEEEARWDSGMNDAAFYYRRKPVIESEDGWVYEYMQPMNRQILSVYGIPTHHFGPPVPRPVSLIDQIKADAWRRGHAVRWPNDFSDDSVSDSLSMDPDETTNRAQDE